MPHQERRTISVEDAGRMLGLSRASSYQAAANGELPTIRIGRRLLVSKAALAKLLDEPVEPEPVAVVAQRGGEIR